MPLEKESVLVQDSSQSQLELSNVLMFKFIKDSMVRLLEEVSVMGETLGRLEQEFITDYQDKVQGMN